MMVCTGMLHGNKQTAYKLPILAIPCKQKFPLLNKTDKNLPLLAILTFLTLPHQTAKFAGKQSEKYLM